MLRFKEEVWRTVPLHKVSRTQSEHRAHGGNSRHLRLARNGARRFDPISTRIAISKVPAPFWRSRSSSDRDSSVCAMCMPPIARGRRPRLARNVATRALAPAMNASSRPPLARTGPNRVLNAFTTCAPARRHAPTASDAFGDLIYTVWLISAEANVWTLANEWRTLGR